MSTCRALDWPANVEALSRRVDRLPIRVATGLGLSFGVGLGFALGLHTWWQGWGASVFLLLLGWLVPWALSGRPVLRTSPRVSTSPEEELPVELGRRVFRLDVDGDLIKVPLIDLPGGVFLMGGSRFDDEKPIHPIRLPAFSIMDVPVTRGLFTAVMGMARDDPSEDPSVPVTGVSWLTAIRFCNRASERAGMTPAYSIDGAQVYWLPAASGFRLPMEAEWEYAARAGSAGEYFFGAQYWATEYAWFGDISLGPQPVRSKKPNDWGLYDMAGNVWEWCWDAYDGYDDHHVKMSDEAFLTAGPVDDRILRGGSFEFPAVWLRSAFRLRFRSINESPDFGFRCVLGSRPSNWSFGI